MDVPAHEWRQALEQRICALESELACAKARSATKAEIFNAEMRMAKWTAGMLLLVAVGILFIVAIWNP
jgi:hypothetical protein